MQPSLKYRRLSPAPPAARGSPAGLKRMFRIALAQMLVDGGRRNDNLQRALARIDEAASKRADVIVLPEALNTGWTHGAADADAEPIPDGPICRALRDAAHRRGMFVCAGLVEREGGSVYNAAVLIDPGGNVVLHHRKIHELEIAHGIYAPGDRLSVARTEFGTLGLMICADAFAPGQAISRTLGFMGADVILSPCAWAVPADHDNAREPYGQLWLDNYGPVARDFRLWIVGVSNVGWLTDGPWKGRKCIGCSMVIGPDGQPVSRAPYGEDADTIVYCDIEPVTRPARGDGWERIWNQRPG